MKRATQLLSVVLLAIAYGCGGGGGGGSSGGPVAIPQVPFTSFTAVAPNTTVVMGGMSLSGNGTEVNTAATGNLVVTSLNVGALDTSGTTVKLTYNAIPTLSALSVTTPTSGVSFSQSAGDQIVCSSGVCVAADRANTKGAIAADAFALGWNYQSFGIWEMDLSTTAMQIGTASAGSPTPASAVPSVGTALFTGLASGFYVDSAGVPYFTAAALSANADFGARSIAFSTTNTQTANLNTNVSAANAGLDLSGTLTYAAGTAQFSGPVTTASTLLTGTAAGRFYGPNAEEIGGVYSLTGTGVTRMIGGFGGKR